MKRFVVATLVALVLAAIYAYLSYHETEELNYRNQAFVIAGGGFSFTISIILLWELALLSDYELGRLKSARSSLIVALIFVCIYVPLAIGGAIIELQKAAPITDNKEIFDREPRGSK